MNKNEVEEKKLSLEEYEKKYSKRQNTKLIKSFSFIVISAIGIVIFCALLFIILKVFDKNEILGYISCGIGAIIFVFFYIVPVVKISKTKAFVTNVNAYNAKEAQKYNKELREEIADGMISFSQETDGIGWYNSELIGKLAIARHTKNDKELKKALTEIYDKDVKNTAKSIISSHAVQVGLVTALSQSGVVDALFVSVYELNLIKQIVFLYGFRPSDAQMAKIYTTVFNNTLIAYGIQSGIDGLTTAAVKSIGGVVKSVPILGELISTAISSVTQGIINASLTVMVGYQTRKYLIKEYQLQDVLDEIELNEEEQNAMIEEVKTEIIKDTKNLKKQTA